MPNIWPISERPQPNLAKLLAPPPPMRLCVPARRGMHERAVQYFRRALRLNPHYLSAWTLMGHEYVELKNPPAAIGKRRAPHWAGEPPCRLGGPSASCAKAGCASCLPHPCACCPFRQLVTLLPHLHCPPSITLQRPTGVRSMCHHATTAPGTAWGRRMSWSTCLTMHSTTSGGGQVVMGTGSNCNKLVVGCVYSECIEWWAGLPAHWEVCRQQTAL